MELLTLFYILNISFLLLHEIESAYEKEWEILNIPGGITVFLVIHFPLIVILLYCLLEINRHSLFGLISGIVTGILGVIPFLVHRVIFYRCDSFNRISSKIIIYVNILTGLFVFYLSLEKLI